MNIQNEKAEQCKKTLYEYLQLHAQGNGNKEYLITEDEVLTYNQALNKVNGLIDRFKTIGISKGTVVALRATRSPKTVMLVIKSGAKRS